jgi:hypothetical protein
MKYEEERKKVISYCRVYCLKCDWLAGNIKEPADKLLTILKIRPELRMWCKGEKDEYDYKNFVGVLEYLSKTGFCRFTCKEGSGYGGSLRSSKFASLSLCKLYIADSVR